MNYRHSFHAGNFADVIKHAILMLLVDYLQRKSAPLFVADSHAGRGIYDLGGTDAQKTGEWQQGIARLMAMPAPADIADLLAPYLGKVAAANPQAKLRTYPGSAALLSQALRENDRALFCEMSGSEASRLRRLCAGDRRIEVIEGNGYETLLRALPPRERRALILIDPPYESLDEFAALENTLPMALRRFAHGVYAIWYPLTSDRQKPDRFLAAMAAQNLAKTLLAEVTMRQRFADGLIGCGMLIINPPYTLETQLRLLLPWLCANLADDGKGVFALSRLA